MSSFSDHDDCLDAFPFPQGSIAIDTSHEIEGERALAIAAMQKVIKDRNLFFPLGPELALHDELRLLSLNHFALQMVTCGVTSDEVKIPLKMWKENDNAPQLILLAQVDEDNQVVFFRGLLTGTEFKDLVPGNISEKDHITLSIHEFQGGIDRLFILIQILDSNVIPRKGLIKDSFFKSLPTILISDWLNGALDTSLEALGAKLEPSTAGVFRNANLFIEDALAIVSIPIGIENNQIICGNQSFDCIERCKLLLIPKGINSPKELLIRIEPNIEGDLLPLGLTCDVIQGVEKYSINPLRNKDISLRIINSDESIKIKINLYDVDSISLPDIKLVQ